MSITVGIDFGTHQTKICVENAENPQQKIYDFLQFDDCNGGFTLLLPSIVQINKDNTLSYGFVDDLKSRYISEYTEKPSLKNPPAKPKKRDKRGLSMPEQMDLEIQYKKDIERWEIEVKRIKTMNDESISNWRRLKDLKCQFRYFKLATYNPESIRWDCSIGPDLVSVLYLTYCLFLICSI